MQLKVNTAPALIHWQPSVDKLATFRPDFGFERLQIELHSLPTGTQVSVYAPANPHDEVFAFVIQGTPGLSLGKETRDLKVDDSVSFQYGCDPTWSFVNLKTETAQILTLRLRGSSQFDGEPRPPPTVEVIAAASLAPAQAFHYAGNSETFGQGVRLSTRLHLRHVGVWLEVLAPGKRSSFPHAHTHEEECALILKGQGELWLHGERKNLQPRDLAGFPPGTGLAHCLINSGSENLIYVMIGEAQERVDEKIIYPLNELRNFECELRGHLWHEAAAVPLGTAPAQAHQTLPQGHLELRLTHTRDRYLLLLDAIPSGEVSVKDEGDGVHATTTLKMRTADALSTQQQEKIFDFLMDFTKRVYRTYDVTYLKLGSDTDGL